MARSMDELEKLLNSPDEETRRRTIEGQIGVPFKPGLLPLIKKAMGDTSWRVRKASLDTALIFQDAIPSIALLMIDALHSEDNVGLRNSAVEGLTRLGIKAVPYLIQNLDDKDRDVRKFILDILGDIGMAKGDRAIDTEGVRVVDALIKATEDPDENVRLSAIEGLGKVGNKKAVDALVNIVEKGDITLRFTTLEALGNIGKPIPMKAVYDACNDKLLKRAAYDLIGKVGGIESIRYLMDGLQEISPSGREAAIAAVRSLALSLGFSGDRLKPYLPQFTPHTIEKIAASLQSNDLKVRKGGVFVLRLIGTREAVLHLIDALRFDDIADEAAEGLIELGNEVVDTLVEVYPIFGTATPSLEYEEALDKIDDENLNPAGKVKALLCYVLGEIGNKKGETILLHAIKDTYGHVRSKAAVALAKVSPERAVIEVLNLLQDEYEDVRNAAVDALCFIAISSQQLVTSGISLFLSMPNPSVREKAVTVLGRIGGPEDIDKIRAALKDDSPLVRKAAVHAIGERGEERYIQDIILALADEDREVRLASTKVLGNLKLEEALNPLLLALKDDDLWVKAAAVESLGKIGRGSAINAIKELVDAYDGMIAVAALEAMAAIAAKEPQAVKSIRPWVAKFLSHNDYEIVKVVVDVLWRIDKKGAVSSILPLLEHPTWDVRAHVVDILLKQKDSLIRNRLETHLKVETDELVRQKIMEGLK